MVVVNIKDIVYIAKKKYLAHTRPSIDIILLISQGDSQVSSATAFEGLYLCCPECHFLDFQAMTMG